MNTVYLIDDDDWQERECEKCNFLEPISLGFNQDSCNTCDEIKPRLASADDYLIYFYGVACENKGADDKDKEEEKEEETKPDETKTDDKDNGGLEKVTEEVTDEEKDSMSTLVLVAVLIVVLILGIFLFYNFYLRPRLYAQHNSARESQRGHAAKAANAPGV